MSDEREAGPDQLADAVAGLVGEPFLWHVSDDRYGAVLSFGERLRRPRPVLNGTLTAEQQQFTGTHSLWINCRCELDVPDHLPDRPARLTDFGFLDLLSERHVLSAVVSRPGLSLRLVFEQEVALDVWPDRGPYQDLWYSVSANGATLTVHHGSSITAVGPED